MTYRTLMRTAMWLYLVFGPSGWSIRTVAVILLADIWLLDAVRGYCLNTRNTHKKGPLPTEKTNEKSI